MVCNDYREFWIIRYCELLWNTCFKVQIDEFFVKHVYRGSQDKMNVSWAGSEKGFRSYFLKDLKTRYILFFEIFWHLWKSMRIKKQKDLVDIIWLVILPRKDKSKIQNEHWRFVSDFCNCPSNIEFKQSWHYSNDVIKLEGINFSSICFYYRLVFALSLWNNITNNLQRNGTFSLPFV